METDILAELISKTTDGVMEASAFDLEIWSDKHRYSTWITGLSTAGLALILNSRDKILPANVQWSWQTYGVATAAVTLLISAVLGGFAAYLIMQRLANMRFKNTHYLYQRIYLLGTPSAMQSLSDLNIVEIMRRIQLGEALPESKQQVLKKTRDKIERLEKQCDRIMLSQQITAALPYVILLITVLSR